VKKEQKPMSDPSEADIDAAIQAMKRCPSYIVRKNKARSDGRLWEVVEDHGDLTGEVSEKTLTVVQSFASEANAQDRANGLWWRSRAVAALSVRSGTNRSR
jgi:hypothetical protein